MMTNYETTKAVEALQHTQAALDAINLLLTSSPHTREMEQKLRDVRTGLAYEIFRWDQK